MTDQAADKRSPIIGGALILTAAFLGAFAWLLNRTATCPDGWWPWDRLSCLEPNALGDTFAGAFAPVAFIWLVAAVLLQRNELAAQRQELRESREVAKQQVDESRKNVSLIEVQTRILEAEQSQRQSKESDEDVLELAELAVQSCAEASSYFFVKDGLPKTLAPFGVIEGGRTAEFARLNTEPLLDLERFLSKLVGLHAFAQEIIKDGGTLNYHGFQEILKLRPEFIGINSVAATSSAPMKARLIRTRIADAEKIIEKLSETLSKHGIDTMGDVEVIDRTRKIDFGKNAEP